MVWKQKNKEHCPKLENKCMKTLSWPRHVLSHFSLVRLLCPWDSADKNTGVGDPGMDPTSLMPPALAGRFFTTSVTWGARLCHSCS